MAVTQQTEPHEVPVNEGESKILGVCIHLGSQDLAALGLADADVVEYFVEDGQLRVRDAER